MLATTHRAVRIAGVKIPVHSVWLAACDGVMLLIAASGVRGELPPAAPGAPAMAQQTRPKVPTWAADAIWYQVLVPRFCNADAANDLPWTRAWTDRWATLFPDEQGPLRVSLSYRRYGGDLQGLTLKLGYLKDLGVNTLYLSPLFQAPSEHKYDTADHRHIDDSLAVAGAADELPPETTDPATWGWSASDKLFLAFLDTAHRQGFRVVLDGVFNHVGRQHWAWRDVLAKGRSSRFADWFAVTDWGPPMRWEAWDGPNGHLVRFRHVGDGLHPEVEAHFFAVARRWLDPNGDGDPHDGIDGWRLDAASDVPHGFWRRFRRVVKGINSEALLLGEIWGDGSAWLSGDQFDAVTNYPFSRTVLGFLAPQEEPVRTTAFVEELDALGRRYPQAVTLAMVDLLDSHDTARAVSMLLDPVAYRKEPDDPVPPRDLLLPGDDAHRRFALAVVLQFTLPGAPLVYYGDEVGMYGGKDPYCRAPMWWPAEKATANPVPADFRPLYRALSRARRAYPALRRGGFRVLLADDARRVIAFQRPHPMGDYLVVLNADGDRHVVELSFPSAREKAQTIAWQSLDPAQVGALGLMESHVKADGLVEVELGPWSACWAPWPPPRVPAR